MLATYRVGTLKKITCRRVQHISHSYPCRCFLGYDIWFGGVQGSLAFVSAFQEENVISIYHYENKEWKIRHIIENISNTGNNDYRYGIPMFFDGKRLSFLLRKKGGDGEIHMHNISTRSWRKIGLIQEPADCIQNFIPFAPTMAKVSGVYLHDQMTQRWVLLQKLKRASKACMSWWNQCILIWFALISLKWIACDRHMHLLIGWIYLHSQTVANCGSMCWTIILFVNHVYQSGAPYIWELSVEGLAAVD